MCTSQLCCVHVSGGDNFHEQRPNNNHILIILSGLRCRRPADTLWPTVNQSSIAAPSNMAAKAVHLVKPDLAEPASGLTIATVDRPVPGEGQVLVEMILRPVNPADIFSLMGV